MVLSIVIHRGIFFEEMESGIYRIKKERLLFGKSDSEPLLFLSSRSVEEAAAFAFEIMPLTQRLHY